MPTLEICYLLLMPLRFTPPGQTDKLTPPKDAPYFFDVDIEFVTVSRRVMTLEGVRISLHLQVLDNTVWLAECRYTLAEALDDSASARKRVLHAALRQKLQTDNGYTGKLVEEYTILLVKNASLAPNEFVDQQAASLARLMRSLDKPPDVAEVSQIFDSRVSYSAHDLTLIDWSGALIVAEEGDFQSDIELMKIGNYQILRYRMLDELIENNLRVLRQHLTHAQRGWLPARDTLLQTTIEQRLDLLLDFEKIDQSLLLIGDWYSTRLYRLIVDQFYLDKWKALISAKLDNLAAINAVIQDNLTFSWRRFLDLLTLSGWLILLAGYFILFFLDLWNRSK